MVKRSAESKDRLKAAGEYSVKNKILTDHHAPERFGLGHLVGKSRAMKEIHQRIQEAAATDAGVVIYGESGTGKELVARTIHRLSNRSDFAFVPVNCGAIPEGLFESEFFGHKKGAYTNADADKPGLFDVANHGTLFLDEVGELSPNLQVKLLRALEGGGYTPVGDLETKIPDVRIVAATNENLRDRIKTGKMREDFFFRIHIIPIYVPPLRDRKEDIELLAKHFIRLYSKDHNIQKIPAQLMDRLHISSWPGNVRELQNVIHRYIAVKSVDCLETTGPAGFLNPKAVPDTYQSTDAAVGEHAADISDLRTAVKNYEKKLIAAALEKTRWNRKNAADRLGIPLRTLSRKMKDHRLI